MKKLQIAVLGTHKRDLPREIYDIAEKIGRYIARKGHVLLTGSSTGISEYASKGAKSVDGLTIGISPYESRQETDSIIHDYNNATIFSGMGYKGRNVLAVRSSDGIIIINGGFGTLNEITIAEGENKPIIVVKNTGGCADRVEDLFKELNPDYKKIHYVEDIDFVVNLLEEIIENE